MSVPTSHTELGFLPVGEAARLLGVSRLRLRQAVANGDIPGKRDNEGRLRVDLSRHDLGKSGTGDLDADRHPAPETLVELLFDEIEELQSDLDEKAAQTGELSDLIERQGAAMLRADDALAGAERDRDRLTALLERAMQHLESPDGDTRLGAVAARALDTLEDAGDRLALVSGHADRLQGLLERVLVVATRSEDLSGGTAASFDATMGRVMAMLDDATSRAEAGQQVAQQASDMVERALDAGEAANRQLADRDQVIARQNVAIDSTLKLSERALALADGAEGTNKVRRGFWGWLMRR